MSKATSMSSRVKPASREKSEPRAANINRLPERRRGVLPSEVEAAVARLLASLEHAPRLRSGRRIDSDFARLSLAVMADLPRRRDAHDPARSAGRQHYRQRRRAENGRTPCRERVWPNV